MYVNTLKEGKQKDVQKNFYLDLNVTSERVNQLIADRCGAPEIQADLVTPDAIQEPSMYKRFSDIDKKSVFKRKLLDSLKEFWVEQYGGGEAEKLIATFVSLADELDENGAVIFASIINKESFQKLIARYNHILTTSGSKSWIHTYVNLGNHPDFLTDKKFNEAFLHPLLLSLVSYRVGGPVRIVDARGKDAEPITVMAQDNMLHIDNTPFCDEYKVLLTWEKNKPSGPKGQNFVFLPGTHKGSRNCFSDEDKGVWSTENASIFVTEAAIEHLFKFQMEIRNADKPFVVEVTHDEKPVTTVFAAGSLVHHRFRTREGFSRSCVIIAFHRAADNPGQLVTIEHLSSLADHSALNKLIVGFQDGDEESKFLTALREKSGEIRSLLLSLDDHEAVQEIIRPKARQLSRAKMQEWKQSSTEAPTVEELKAKAGFQPLHKELSQDEFVCFVKKMMSFDKHGPLDLILYSDGHEEIRKWARNQIREMNIDEMENRIDIEWVSDLGQPSEQSILSTKELETIAQLLSEISLKKKSANTSINLRKEEKISREQAYDSITQLLLDLGESVTRCENRQAFLSTSLFLFLAADTLMRFENRYDFEVRQIGKKLLDHYISTVILIKKQIELKPKI